MPTRCQLENQVDKTRDIRVKQHQSSLNQQIGHAIYKFTPYVRHAGQRE